MELLRVSDCKMKITLTPEDMERFELQCESMDYADIETKRAFREIMDEVKLQTDFDASCGRVMIQVFPSKDGGCEMFITKLPEAIERDENSLLAQEPPDTKEQALHYCFTNQQYLLDACYVLKASGYSDESSVYTDEKNVYHLILCGEDVPILIEFADAKYVERDIATFSKRHVCLIKRDAISVLATLK